MQKTAKMDPTLSLNAGGFSDKLVYEYHLNETFDRITDSFENLQEETYITQIKTERVSSSEIKIKIALIGTYMLKEDQ